MLKHIFTVALLSLLAFTNAKASLLIEPILGYNAASEAGFSNAKKYDYSGPGYGARLGLQYLGVMFGLDHQIHNVEFDNATGKVDVESTQTGVFIGFDAPLLVRVWATYLLSADYEPETGTKFDEGSGLKLGVGLKLLPLVSLNVEYMKYEYEKGGGVTLPSKLEQNGLFFSVSLPLTL